MLYVKKKLSLIVLLNAKISIINETSSQSIPLHTVLCLSRD